MSTQTEYTDEQKKAYVVIAQQKGRGAAAKKAGVSKGAISAWAKKIGMTLPHGQRPTKKAAPKRRLQKEYGSKNNKANGAANGHASNGHASNGHSAPLLPRPSGELALIEPQLARAPE